LSIEDVNYAKLEEYKSGLFKRIGEIFKGQLYKKGITIDHPYEIVDSVRVGDSINTTTETQSKRDNYRIFLNNKNLYSQITIDSKFKSLKTEVALLNDTCVTLRHGFMDTGALYFCIISVALFIISLLTGKNFFNAFSIIMIFLILSSIVGMFAISNAKKKFLDNIDEIFTNVSLFAEAVTDTFDKFKMKDFGFAIEKKTISLRMLDRIDAHQKNIQYNPEEGEELGEIPLIDSHGFNFDKAEVLEIYSKYGAWEYFTITHNQES
jgi:hypothetical protein